MKIVGCLEKNWVSCHWKCVNSSRKHYREELNSHVAGLDWMAFKVPLECVHWSKTEWNRTGAYSPPKLSPLAVNGTITLIRTHAQKHRITYLCHLISVLSVAMFYRVYLYIITPSLEFPHSLHTDLVLIQSLFASSQVALLLTPGHNYQNNNSKMPF